LVNGCGSHRESIASNSPSTRPATLAAYLNQTLDDENAKVVGEIYESMFREKLDDPELLAVRRIVNFRSGAARFAMIREPTFISVPGFACYEATLFDGDWKKIVRTVVLTGYRMLPVSLDVEHSDIVSSDVFVNTLGSAVVRSS
jgi:hypothetical protein